MSEQKDLNYDPRDPDRMDLPAGKTCEDCGNISRCRHLFGCSDANTRCDWSPSRFVMVRKSDHRR